uniref:LRRcap domain-containing protein n=1 Tax=Macrostomum lignano TaxID=282301 RepID=A0A1I8GCT5_9PLAT
MASREQRDVPDLLSDLPLGRNNGGQAKLKQTKTGPASKPVKPVAMASAPNSAQSSQGRTADKASPSSVSGQQLLPQRPKPVSASASTTSKKTQVVTGKKEEDSELTFKELFKRLKILDLSSNSISEISNLFDNKELKELKLYDNMITSICLLESQKDLSSLQLQYNQIAKIGSGLAPLKKLNSLKLNNNELRTMEVKELAPMSQLTFLDVSFNQLKDISAVVCLPHLEELRADNNLLESLPDFSRCRKRLTSLSLSDNRLAEFGWLPNACSNVYTLDMSNNGPVEMDERLAAALGRLGNLFELSFTNCLTPVAAVQKLLPNLDYFNGFTLHRPSTPSGAGGHGGGGAPPPMRPMSAASAVTARQVENQLRSLESRMVSMEEQTEQAFLHLRSRLGQKLAPAPNPTSPTASLQQDANDEALAGDGAPLTGRASSRRDRLRDALEFGRQSRAL